MNCPVVDMEVNCPKLSAGLSEGGDGDIDSDSVGKTLMEGNGGGNGHCDGGACGVERRGRWDGRRWQGSKSNGKALAMVLMQAGRTVKMEMRRKLDWPKVEMVELGLAEGGNGVSRMLPMVINERGNGVGGAGLAESGDGEMMGMG